MCSNFQAITREHTDWISEHFQCELPFGDWESEVYPMKPAPFIWLDDGKPRCDLANFGLITFWAANKPRFGTRTYNARSDDGIATKPSFQNAWKRCQFGLAVMQSFYEPLWHEGKATRWRIKRSDGQPIAVASFWERYVDHGTGELKMSFSMLTINATDHPVMQRFHAAEDEKRSIVVLQHNDAYHAWLNADQEKARGFLRLVPDHFLVCEAAPRVSPKSNDKG